MASEVTLIDPYRCVIGPLRYVDRHGFIVASVVERATPDVAARDTRRLVKLAQLLAKWLRSEAPQRFVEAHRAKLRAAFRCGLPVEVRGAFWREMAAIRVPHVAFNVAEDYYATLLGATTSDSAQIQRDLPRTFPSHILFARTHGVGQVHLYNVLRAFSCHAPDVGYCQGMAFVAALLLMRVDEETAFWMFVRIAESCMMAKIWAPSMRSLHEAIHIFERLVQRHLPRVHAHCDALGFTMANVVTQHFISLFCVNVRFETTLRVLDLFWIEGPRVLYKVLLAYFALHETLILQATYETLHDLVRYWNRQEFSDDALVRCALDYHLREEIREAKRSFTM